MSKSQKGTFEIKKTQFNIKKIKTYAGIYNTIPNSKYFINYYKK